MSSNAHRRSFSRLALALAAAGLLVASLPGRRRRGASARRPAAAAAGPTFDPLLDTGPASVCGPLAGASLKIPSAWLVAAVAKTETAPFQPQPMKAAGGDVPLYRDLGTLAFPITHPQRAGAGLLQPGHAARRSPSTTPRRSAPSRRRRSSIRTAPSASGARR